jgi:diguanylate cyclase (GGDEF)-like protein
MEAVSRISASYGSYEEQLLSRARLSGLIIVLVAVVVVPLWGIFDEVLEPAHAHAFIMVRLLCDLPMLACAWALTRPVGHRRPQLFTVATLAVVQAEIAWMVVQASQARAFYLLGFSLAIYASGCIMGGRARWTGACVVVTWTAFVVALLTAGRGMSGKDITASVFYLATASIIGLIGHEQRDRSDRREQAVRLRLEEEQTRAEQLLERLGRLSNEDPLTGLANRRRWDSALESACDHARGDGSCVAVVLIDVDRFKLVNDQHGHSVGDEALRAVGSVVTGRLRHGDLVARLGGDEFGVLLVGADAQEATGLAEELQEHARGLTVFQRYQVTLSLGVAMLAADAAEPGALMANADRQLYRAKSTRDAIAVEPVGR